MKAKEIIYLITAISLSIGILIAIFMNPNPSAYRNLFWGLLIGYNLPLVYSLLNKLLNQLKKEKED